MPSDAGRRFYLITMEETEAQEPWLEGCGLPVWAAIAYQQLDASPLRTLEPAAAALWVFPPYYAWETNWPKYDKGQFQPPNVAREGYECGTHKEQAHLVAIAMRQWLINTSLPSEPRLAQRAPRLLVMDMFPWTPEPDLVHYFSDDRLAWAKLSTIDSFYRPDVDVSLPPPAHDPLRFVPHIQALRGGSRAPAKYLVSFKGRLEMHPVRRELAKLHNETQGVIIVDKNDEKFDYAATMGSSAFTLAVRGDNAYSYRFTEAACAGSAPVIIADGWVPPFNSTMPLHDYGLRVREADVGPGMVERLAAIPAAEVARLRRNALRFCRRYAASVELTADAMVREALQKASDIAPASLAWRPLRNVTL